MSLLRQPYEGAQFVRFEHGPITNSLNARSQNVPKIKVERAKPVEIAGDQKKVLEAESID
jgi:hypothetical protein